MKKILLIIFAAFFSLLSPAQCTSFPENGFENWISENDTTFMGQPIVYEHPTDTWFSFLDAFGYLWTGAGNPILNKTTDKYNGTYAMKMTASPGNDGDLMGIGAITSRPQKITGYFKYNGSTNDSLTITASLITGPPLDYIFNGDTSAAIARAVKLQTAAVGTYTKFSINFNYKSSATPDSFAIVIVLNNHNTSDISAWLDDICFEGTTSIAESENITNCKFFNTGNNIFLLSTDFLRPIGNITARIYDLSGREVVNRVLNTGSSADFMEEFDLHGLNSGIYFLQLQNNEVTINRKFSVK